MDIILETDNSDLENVSSFLNRNGIILTLFAMGGGAASQAPPPILIA